MIICFQDHKEKYVLYALLFSIFIMMQSCDSHKSAGSEKMVMADDSNYTTQDILPNSDGNKSLIPPRFPDTIKLKEIGIAYQKIESNRFYDKWLLELIDTIPKSKQILGLTYNIVTNLHDDNKDVDNRNVLFQLDSLIIQLSDGEQAFGFNEDGPYFHSYESLLEPNIIFDDYNFDGIIDFSVQSGGSGTNESRYFHIFNPKRKSFNKSIGMANASFDKNKKIVYQGWRMNSSEWSRCSFRFSKGDTLIKFRCESRIYIDSIDSYVKEVELLQEDGSYSSILDTIKRK